MDPWEIGRFRRCPACGRPVDEDVQVVDRLLTKHDDDLIAYAGVVRSIECSCCKRLWEFCPCTPVEEGPCRAEMPG